MEYIGQKTLLFPQTHIPLAQEAVFKRHLLAKYGREERYLGKASQLNMGQTAKSSVREDKLTVVNWAGAGFTLKYSNWTYRKVKDEEIKPYIKILQFLPVNVLCHIHPGSFPVFKTSWAGKILLKSVF